MISLFLNALLFSEIFFLAYASLWLLDLYISNETYIRDIFLIIAGFCGILLNEFILLGCLRVIPVITMVVISLTSFFKLTNVNSSKDKWLSNIFKAISAMLLFYSISTENALAYFIAFIFFMIFETIFSIKNNSPIFCRVISYILYGCAFTIIYSYFIGQISFVPLYLDKIIIILFSSVLNVRIFHRIKRVIKSSN